MKKAFRIIGITVLVIMGLVIIKNFILYWTGDYDVEYLTKVEENESYVKYACSLDLVEGYLYDQREYISVTFYPDSTGEYTTDTYTNKITGRASDGFSFASLLPYDKSMGHETVQGFKVEGEFLKIEIDTSKVVMVDSTDANGRRDSIFVKYKIDSGRLYLDRMKEYTPYTREPKWGFEFNASPNLAYMFNPYYWFNLLLNTAGDIKEIFE